MNNIKNIQELNLEDVISLIKRLISHLGYSEIISTEDSVMGELKTPLGSDLHHFIILENRLSGNIDEKEILKKVNELKVSSRANTFYIVSNYHISNGFKKTIEREIDIKPNYIDRDGLIDLIDKNYSDFWKHDDLNLIEYEKSYCSLVNRDDEIKRLKLFNDKYQRLLDIFIEPRIFHTYEDKTTGTPVRKRTEMSQLISDKKNKLISGDAGTGKTTLLKKIGEKLIDENTEKEIKNIPIFLTAIELVENKNNIEEIIEFKLCNCFENCDADFFKKYCVVLLLDSIDELEKSSQKEIIIKLNDLCDSKAVNYYLGTRNHESISSLYERDGFNVYQIEKFNNEQIKKFVSSFFLGEKNKADELIDSLKENRIIERMPITPLTLSLISILYEENNLEIPATIADIYDNFNSLIIGRTSATSRIEFIDISFKERILSLYALELLNRQDHTPMTKDEFFKFFLNYYKEKTLPIKKGSLEDVLDYLIEHTGIITIKDEKWVKFSHDSYMEYYSALEIFKHQRGLESDLIDNFLDHHWQNVAIFYAGKSKDQPEFLKKIIHKIRMVSNLQDSFMGVLGIGYLLQALFQTDNIIRKDAVLEALRLSVNTYETTMKLASDNTYLFKSYKLPILQLMNLMYFFENFNSLTVKEPLRLAFNSVLESYREKNNTIEGYKAIKLALTLDSRRINHSDALTLLIDEKKMLDNPSLYLILDFGMDLLGKEKYKSFKNEIKKNHFNKISEPLRKLVQLPASRLRFTNLDTLTNERDVKLIVEGKTDAEIIEHAYYTLTGGNMPYWNITSAGNQSGGAAAVAKSLMAAKSLKETSSKVIGVFDHDAAGLQEYRGLKKSTFTEVTKDSLKQHCTDEIFAICIPVPGELDFYLQKEQEFNMFEIEHYFDIGMLKEMDIVTESPISNIFKVKDSKKKGFSKWVREQTSSEIFINFMELFQKIDKICGQEIDYIE